MRVSWPGKSQTVDKKKKNHNGNKALQIWLTVEEGALFSEGGQIGVGGRIVKEEKAKLVKSLSPSVI